MQRIIYLRDLRVSKNTRRRIPEETHGRFLLFRSESAMLSEKLNLGEDTDCSACENRKAQDESRCGQCRYAVLSRGVDVRSLSRLYRLLLKIPFVDYIDSAPGLFWAVVVPMLLALDMLLNMYLLLCTPFPANVILVALLPCAAFVAFAKINLVRFINWWNSMIAKSDFTWDIERSVEEYTELLAKQKSKKNRG